MNPRSGKRRVVCFGDDNVCCGVEYGGRMIGEANVWMHLLEDLLGDGYEVIKEGLPGRLVTGDDAFEDFKNGYNYLVPFLISHSDLDAIIFMIGSADTKVYLNNTVDDIIDGLGEMLSIAGELAPDAKLVVACPPIVNEEVAGSEYVGASEKVRGLREGFAELARKYGVDFVDANRFGDVGKDGVTLAIGSEAFASELVRIVRGYFEE